jgi:hypothetical protein
MSRRPEGENILGAVESIIDEARDLNRSYPTILRFRTAEIFRNEVAVFMSGRRVWRNAAESVERGEEVGGFLGFIDNLIEAEEGESLLKQIDTDKTRKNDPEYIAEQLLPKLVVVVPLERKTTDEIYAELLQQFRTGIDPEADRTVSVELSQREVDFLTQKARSSIETREVEKGELDLDETHIRELEEAFKKATQE